MKTHQIIPIFFFAVLAVSCKSVQPIAAGTASIVIKNPERKAMGFGRHTDFPAGIYAPDFQTDKGVYFLAPTKLVLNGLGFHRPQRGGLFVPHPNNSNQKQAMWVDQQEGSGGLLGAGLTSTTRLWYFDEPIKFELQKTENK